MDKKQVVELLNSGDFEIEYCEDCNCLFDWHIDEDCELSDNVESSGCWDSNVLFVTGRDEPIAEFIRHEGLSIRIDDMFEYDIPHHILDEMRLLSDVVERGETGNPEVHNEKRKTTLVEYLMECGYELDMDDNRGFANEYTMILRDTGEPIYPTLDEAEEWADSYLYRGDAATESFVNFRFDHRE